MHLLYIAASCWCNTVAKLVVYSTKIYYDFRVSTTIPTRPRARTANPSKKLHFNDTVLKYWDKSQLVQQKDKSANVNYVVMLPQIDKCSAFVGVMVESRIAV